uniref:Uncharacterized protein n=1 Tax=Anguilla anguilla TaxID=7936 RepID=A0A0E9Q3H9_ANGAN
MLGREAGIIDHLKLHPEVHVKPFKAKLQINCLNGLSGKRRLPTAQQ